MKKIGSLAIVFLFFMSACDQKEERLDAPQRVLESYIERRFSAQKPEDRLKLTELTTGKVKKRLEQMPEEEFKKVFLDKKLTFERLVILAKRNPDPETAQITYEIRLKDFSSPEGEDKKTSKTATRIVNKKIALFRKEQDKWLISDADNLKTAVEFKDSVVVLPR
jgi:hypothetical protein